MGTDSIGLSALSYCLPSLKLGLTQLHREGKLRSDPEVLRSLGWSHAYVSHSGNPLELVDRAVGDIFAQGISPQEVDALIFCGATIRTFIEGNHLSEGDDLWDLFRYPASHLQDRWGMVRAAVFPLAQQGCTTLLSGIRLARSLLRSEPDISKVLCVSMDVLPSSAKREMIYSVLSDGACAVLVERGSPRNEILAIEQVTKGYYWDPKTLEMELMAAYFPTARNVILRTLERSGLAPTDLRWVVPHNITLQSWRILFALLGWPLDLLFSDNISEKGHTIAADNVVNLKDIIDRRLVEPGQNLLLFSFGLGATWAGVMLRH